MAEVEIDDVLLSLYVGEILYAQAMAHSAARDLDAALRAEDQDPAVFDRVFGSSQAILTAASTIFWIFTPDRDGRRAQDQKNFSQERARRIQEALGSLPPVLESRAVRNSMEHFAAKLDDHLVERPNVITHNAITHSGADGILIGGEKPFYVRAVERDTGRLSVLAESISLLEVMDAIYDVAGRANAWRASRNY